uniref:Cilia- and flagella-associated protein 206 n=1 Tax=Mesocestoides corti TaxID=53468 RepID=A0A5K3FEU8_MESCO
MKAVCRPPSPPQTKSEAQAIIASLISDIICECRNRGEDVAEPVAAFLVKAVLINKENGFEENRLLYSADVQRLKEMCINRLMDLDSPTLDTIKMQIFFDLNYITK